MGSSTGKPMLDFDLLHEAVPKMLDVIEECYKDVDRRVLPNVKPGFLRNQLPQNPPEDGQTVEHLLERTRNAIFLGMQNWQSPKFYGYFPSNPSSTILLAEMFTSIFQTPSFGFAVSPSYTQLENTMVDWGVKALGLPEQFLLKNKGGGIISNCQSEAIIVGVHVAKFKKLTEVGHQKYMKLVGYYGEGSHIGSKRCLVFKDIYHQKPAPYVYDSSILNYRIDLDSFEKMVQEDVKNGLVPFWFGASYGTTFSVAIDLEPRLVDICKKYGMWINLDCAFLGSTWVCPHLRPKDPQLLKSVDSMQINFSKFCFNGIGASLTYYANKRLLFRSFGQPNPEFTILENEYSGEKNVIDYKDWTFGLSRRNSNLRLYYFWTFYGLKRIRQAIQDQQKKADYLVERIKQHPDLFEVHSYRFLTVLFRVKDNAGKPSNERTKLVADMTKNIYQGFSTPGSFKGNEMLRIVVGVTTCQKSHIDLYFEKIRSTALWLKKNQHIRRSLNPDHEY